jgi:hypothetical protein
MDSDNEGAGSSPPSSPWSSSGGRDGSMSDATSATATIPATPLETIGCQQANLKDELKQLAVHLAKEKAPRAVRNGGVIKFSE